MPYFSSGQEDLQMRHTHRAVEDLSYEAQRVQFEFMTNNLELTESQMDRLTRICRAATRQLRALVVGHEEGWPP